MKYPFENAHPLKDERFYNFMYCLCKYERRIEDENSFLSLLQIEECKRTEIELKDPLKVVQPLIQKLKEQGVNIIILLNHIGIDKDIELAQNLTDVDIIVINL